MCPNNLALFLTTDVLILDMTSTSRAVCIALVYDEKGEPHQCSNIIGEKTNKGEKEQDINDGASKTEASYSGDFCIQHYNITRPFYRAYKKVSQDALNLYHHMIQNQNSNLTEQTQLCTDYTRCHGKLSLAIQRRNEFLDTFIYVKCRDEAHMEFIQSLMDSRTHCKAMLQASYFMQSKVQVNSSSAENTDKAETHNDNELSKDAKEQMEQAPALLKNNREKNKLKKLRRKLKPFLEQAVKESVSGTNEIQQLFNSLPTQWTQLADKINHECLLPQLYENCLKDIFYGSHTNVQEREITDINQRIKQVPKRMLLHINFFKRFERQAVSDSLGLLFLLLGRLLSTKAAVYTNLSKRCQDIIDEMFDMLRSLQEIEVKHAFGAHATIKAFQSLIKASEIRQELYRPTPIHKTQYPVDNSYPDRLLSLWVCLLQNIDFTVNEARSLCEVLTNKQLIEQYWFENFELLFKLTPISFKTQFIDVFQGWRSQIYYFYSFNPPDLIRKQIQWIAYDHHCPLIPMCASNRERYTNLSDTRRDEYDMIVVKCLFTNKYVSLGWAILLNLDTLFSQKEIQFSNELVDEVLTQFTGFFSSNS